MNGIHGIIIKFYRFLLCFYPVKFRSEYAEDMLLDFSALAAEASQKGKLYLVLFYLRELVEFPINLLRIHLEEGVVLKKLRSEPTSMGWRSAVAFGFVFGFSTLMNALVFWVEANIKISIPDRLQFLFERFLLDWTGFLLTGLAFGILFALLFADPSRFSRYALIGALGWFLQLPTYNFLEYFFDFWDHLNGQENLYLSNLRSILDGAIVGLIFVVAQSERRGAVRLLAVYAVAYPILIYLYVELISNAPWLFIAFAILWMILIAGIFILTNIVATNRQIIRIVVAGAIGSVILRLLTGIVAFNFIPPVPPEGFLYENPLFWPVVLILMAANIMYGILLGFLLGWIQGSQKNSDLQQVLT